MSRHESSFRSQTLRVARPVGTCVLERVRVRGGFLSVLAWLLVTSGAPTPLRAESLEDRVERLERDQQVLKEELEKKDARIEKLESELEREEGGVEPSEEAGASDADATGAADGAAVSTAATAEPEEAAGDEEATPESAPTQPTQEEWGVYDPGKGFLIGRNQLGEASISAYALVRYINQMDSNRKFRDHLGQVRDVDTRENIQAHRTLIWLSGWAATPKLRYQIAWWTVQDTDQDAIFGNLGYLFHKRFRLFGGINGNPGSRSLQGSHPFWLGHDRVMADEFFRPFFTQGVWANGELLPGFWYSAMAGNNTSTLGATAASLDRDFTFGGSLWWMPTTHEFGPRGAYGDWEMHEELATRFGVSSVYSPELRQSDTGQSANNTALRLADSVNLFDTGALAPGVTVRNADYNNLSVDAGLKYRGFFLQAEYYVRWLKNFQADGPLPDDEIIDHGFYVQAAFFPLPKIVELYTATSQIFGDGGAGFGDSSEYIAGVNYYPFDTRNHRVNVQYINVNGSPVSSDFGYYRGGQDGSTVTVGVSVSF